MDTLEFLRRVQAPDGLHVLALQKQGQQGAYFTHETYPSLEVLAQAVTHFDTAGQTVFYAVNTYASPLYDTGIPDPKRPGETKKRLRVAQNVASCKSFYLDIDVGDEPGKYTTREEAMVALVDWLKKLEIGVPLVVGSGPKGLHCYFTMTQAIAPEAWRQSAEKLKLLAIHLGLLADHKCTSDIARVLRPVGAHHRKAAPVQVQCLHPGADIDYGTFSARLDALIATLHIDTRTVSLTKQVRATVNEGAGVVYYDRAPASAEKIATACAQLRAVRDTRGDVPEPHWYAAIQLLLFCKEGEPQVHAWSNGYAGYSAHETDSKIAQLRSNPVIGPTTCSHFETVNPKGCNNCPFRGSIKSPITLGREHEKAASLSVLTFETADALPLLDPPAPFKRVKKEGEEADEAQLIISLDRGVERVVYPYDVYVSEQAVDETDGSHFIRLHHMQPGTGWREFMLPQSLLAKPGDLMERLYENDVMVSGEFKEVFMEYLRSYLEELKRNRRAPRVRSRYLGWRTDPDGFQVGERLYTQDAKVLKASVADQFLHVNESFTMAGDVAEWSKLADMIAAPQFAPHRTALNCAFGAPLMDILGYGGVIFNMLGPTDSGKTTVGRMVLSVWGNFASDQLDGRNDTATYRIEKLGFFNNLPFYVDEITNIEPQQASDFAYAISSGSGKGRARSDASLREKAHWSTIILSSSNRSYRTILSQFKKDSEAEQMRVFEFEFPRVEGYKEWANAVHRIVDQHHGVAGDTFIRYLVTQDRVKLREQLDQFKTQLETVLEMRAGERYWFAGIACNLFGAYIAHKLGLITYDPMHDLEWLRTQLRNSRTEISEVVVPSDNLLSMFIDRFQTGRITVKKLPGSEQLVVMKQPNGPLCMRLDLDAAIIHVALDPLRAWLAEQNASFSELRKWLASQGALVDQRARRNLGADTIYTGGRVYCWTIDLRKLNGGELWDALQSDGQTVAQ